MIQEEGEKQKRFAKGKAGWNKWKWGKVVGLLNKIN